MAWRAYDISISLGEHLFKFIPKECYNVTEEKMEDRDNKVIMYELIHEFKGSIKKATIPYYVSNGPTNRLNADMLFPFMCFTDRKNIEPLCPHSLFRPGETSNLADFGLLKYSATKNMDTEAIVTSVNLNYLQKYSQVGLDVLDSLSNKDTRGITSIFVRIQNVLDFIISCSSQKLVDYKTDYTEEQLNAFIPDGPSPIYQRALPYEKAYRRCVLDKLHDMIQALQRTHLVTFTPKMMTIEKKTYDEFNSLIHICQNQKPNQRAQSNLHTYKIISNELYQLVYAFNSSTGMFPYLLPIDRVIQLKDNELNEMMDRWYASCGSKSINAVVVGLRRNPANTIFNQIQLYGQQVLVTDYKKYTPLEKQIVNDLFFEKINEFLSDTSPYESLKLIEPYRQKMSVELYDRLVNSYSAQIAAADIMKDLSLSKFLTLIERLKKTQPNLIFENIQRYGQQVLVDNYKTYSPEEKKIVNDIFFDKITDFLVDKSPDDALTLIESYKSNMFPELYEQLIPMYLTQMTIRNEKIKEFLSTKSPEESLTLLESYKASMSPDLYDQLTNRYSAQVATEEIMKRLSLPRKGMRRKTKKSKKRVKKGAKDKKA
jgi:hypothetical protein